jgi:hypothetical protein
VLGALTSVKSYIIFLLIRRFLAGTRGFFLCVHADHHIKACISIQPVIEILFVKILRYKEMISTDNEPMGALGAAKTAAVQYQHGTMNNLVKPGQTDPIKNNLLKPGQTDSVKNKDKNKNAKADAAQSQEGLINNLLKPGQTDAIKNNLLKPGQTGSVKNKAALFQEPLINNLLKSWLTDSVKNSNYILDMLA